MTPVNFVNVGISSGIQLWIDANGYLSYRLYTHRDNKCISSTAFDIVSEPVGWMSAARNGFYGVTVWYSVVEGDFKYRLDGELQKDGFAWEAPEPIFPMTVN